MSQRSIGMRVARADKEDLEAAFDLYKLLDAIESGSFPPGDDEDDGEWNDFDERNRDDLLKFYETCMAIFSRHPSWFMRVLFAASCALDERNKLFDPAQDHLAHHPSIIETAKQRDELINALAEIQHYSPVGSTCYEIATRAINAMEDDQ
jgi:hypothetical protein